MKVLLLADPLLSLVAGSIWLILPAFFANAAPVFVGGGPPIDGGRVWRDGHRLFGDGKTWRGFIGGVIVGTIIGIIQYFIEGATYDGVIVRGFLLGFGALSGDLIGSFIKRRLNIARGQPFIGMDQLGFMIVGMALVIVFYPITLLPMNFSLDLLIINPIHIQFTWENLLYYIVILFPVTFLAHISANLIFRRTL